MCNNSQNQLKEIKYKQYDDRPVSHIVRLSRDNETSTGTDGTVDMVTDSPLAGI